MLVFVATPEHFKDAFDNWIKETGTDDRKMHKVVFDDFMQSDQAMMFHTVTHLISFPINEWLTQFNLWRDLEIKYYPQHLEKINYWTIRLSHLMQSSWSIDSKLIVRECFESSDIKTPSEPDLFDQLMKAV